MKKRLIAFLLALSLTAAAMPALAAEDVPSSDGEKRAEVDNKYQDMLDKVQNAAGSAIESLGKKDWEKLAASVKKTGDWREDLVAVAQTQIGYIQEKDGMTLYTRWAGEEEAAYWSAFFINWVAEKIGLTTRQFPQGDTYKSLRSKMNNVKALKKVTRIDYPASGDLALIETDGQTLVGIVVYVGNGFASVIHGGDKGRVTKKTYAVGKDEFKYYIDLNVLMERAGIEIGKGGTVPVIPEEGVAGWTNTNAVYMRAEPSIASKRLVTVKKPNTPVLVVSAALQDDGYIWYGIKYKNYEGYIRGDLLKLDLTAIPSGTPVPEVTPAPVQPDQPQTDACALCTREAQGSAMPADCCYEQLLQMGGAQAGRYLLSLMKSDLNTFMLYIRCCNAHMDGGKQELLCLGAACGLASWTMPSRLHNEACPWHTDGFAVQERVVNIEVKDARAGQEITILYELYGAQDYQWYEVRTVENADGTATTTDTLLEGETNAALTLTAKQEANTTYSYYCKATILANGSPVTLTSKNTVVNAGVKPVTAQAILGEEVNFTYEYVGAKAYQWYVQADASAVPLAIAADDAAYTGADTSTLTFHATAENAGALYSCVALDAQGRTIRASSFYAYEINVYLSAPDASVCEGHDLCKYVEELVVMTRGERFTALTETWYTSVVEVSGEGTPGDCLAEYVIFHWYLCHAQTYPHLLCTCSPTEEDRLMLHPYEEQHEAECPWYIAPKSDTKVIEKRADQDEFDKWAVTATPEMIARAKTAPTLGHAVLEPRDDNTYALYIVRYAEPVGAVDANGYMTYGTPALAIAWVDFSTGEVYAMNNLPSHAPAYKE